MYATAIEPDAQAAIVSAAIQRMAALADHGEIEDYVSCLADDAKWTIATGDRLRVQRRTEIEAGARRRRANGTGGPGSGREHTVTTVAVSLLADGHAAAISFYMLVQVDGAESALVSCGRYDDIWRWEKFGLRITSRTVSSGLSQ